MIKLAAKAKLPTLAGKFDIYTFQNEVANENAVIVKGDIQGKEDVPMRIHSECLTGDVFGSERCDCRDQLLKSMVYLGEQPYGLLIYLRQEGRGIGLINKIKAYQLQEEGYDTVEANLKLGLPADKRDYTYAVEVLRYFGIKSVRIMTNNPEKISFLEANGIKVTDRITIKSQFTDYNKFYLLTKKEKMGHQI
ncbi:MAG: GTP cyclohydrolase II [Candidatus Thermoplasmatota archaeon]|jgi:GTP cyclohydrolase II/3,4-dihydroxy 2-butanone 4-phosphate synthase/GTP cyclohydrolase II|nr:GTP cyclohydrolase II [Candidatus Thermoplasmatota archaeon]MCL5987613.1 GTP cyclohydrolase II [Candidatus Thermoplasmatota archaeon]